MTAEIDLLPLPAENYVDDEGLWEKRYGPYSPDQMKDYARANVLHHTATLQAEVEALRAEVSGLRAARIAYANEFPATEDGDPDTGNIHANIRALKARAEQLAAEVERLRRLVQERDTMLGKRLCAGTNADGKPRCLVLAEEHARAERLAEALREAADDLEREIDAKIVVAQLRATMDQEEGHE